MQDDNAQYRFDLRRALLLIRRRGWVAILFVVLAAGASYGFSISQPKQYTATASLLLHDAGVAQNLLTTSSAPTVDPTREAQTEIAVVSSPEVATLTAAALHKPVASISSEVTASEQGQTNVVSVQATDPSPSYAALLANSYVSHAVSLARQTDRAQVADALAALQSQLSALPPAVQTGAEGQALSGRIEQLKLYAAADTGNTQVLAPASVPTSSSGPSTKRNLMLGVVFGLLLGLGAAVLLERLNRGVRLSAELGELYGLPLLTEVPNCRALKRGRGTLPTSAREAFRMLRGRLVYSHHELGSVLVTSAVEKEGRSTIAWHLAAAAATGGQRVLLLEADIRAPVFARRYGLRTGPGLAEILEGRSEVNDAIQWVAVAGPAKGHSSDGVLDVIVAGSTAQTPAALLENGAMRELLDGLIADHDLVVIDAPAALQVADAMPLLRRVDGVLVVGRVGLTTPDQARRLSEQLRDLDAPTLGLVANSVRREESSRHAYPSSTSLRQPANGASAPGSAARAR